MDPNQNQFSSAWERDNFSGAWGTGPAPHQGRTELPEWKQREIYGDNWVEPVDPGEELLVNPPTGRYGWTHLQHEEW
jgi:hypothetical protein